MLGYKHTKQAKAKMKARFLNKKNHPMFGKTHSETTKQLISIKKVKHLQVYMMKTITLAPWGREIFESGRNSK